MKSNEVYLYVLIISYKYIHLWYTLLTSFFVNFTSSSSFEKEFEIRRSNLLNHKSRNFSEEKTERERKFYSSKRLKFWNIFGRKNERNVPDSREGGSERPRPRLGITNEWSEIRPRGLLLTRPVRLSRRYFNLRGFGAAARVPAKCRTNLQTNDGKHFPRLSRVASTPLFVDHLISPPRISHHIPLDRCANLFANRANTSLFVQSSILIKRFRIITFKQLLLYLGFSW